MSPDGNWEGRSILHVAGSPDAAPDPALVERARAALLADRAKRVRPGRDDKQLAAWNGLALRAFALAALVLGDERFVEATRRLRLVHPRERRARRGSAVALGPRAASRWCRALPRITPWLPTAYWARTRRSATPDDLRLAEALMARLAADFWDEASGTLYDTGPEHEQGVVRPRSLLDGATPGANSVAADVWLRLALLTGEPEHDRRARRILAAVGTALERQPSAFGRMLCAADRALRPAVDVVVAGDAADPRSIALRRAAAAPYEPDLVIATAAPGDDLGERPLFAGKTARDGAPTAYVCRGYACDAPTTDPAIVSEQVARLAVRT